MLTINTDKNSVCKLPVPYVIPIISYTVGENIIATTRIRNNYGAIQPLIFSCRSFSLLKAIAKKKL